MKQVLLSLLILFVITHTFSWDKHKQTSQQAANPDLKNRSLYTSRGRIDATTGITRAQYLTDRQTLAGTPEQIARTYLSMYHSTFGLTKSGNELSLRMVQHSRSEYHVRFNQTIENVPVYRGDVVVSINKDNQVTFVVNNSTPGLALTTTTPSLSMLDAREQALKELNIKGKILTEVEPELIILRQDEKGFLAYRCVITSNNPRGVWEVFVDATTSGILQLEDIAVYGKKGKSGSFAQGRGYVFDPDPLTSAQVTYNTTGYTDGNDAVTTQLNNQRILVDLLEISQIGGTYFLEGPYVTIDDWDTPNIAPATATHPDSFRFSRNQTGFEDVNAYYHIDKSQRYIQYLAFDIQNLSIHVDPHGFDGQDNAFYSPGNNSLSFGDGGVDDAEDADVILHEYGHAIHNGTVPGWGGYEEGALGEGFGDYWAATYSREVNPTFSRNFFPTWDAGFNGNTGSVWGGRPLNDTRIYPDNGVAGMEVHNAGQIWSSMTLSLWDELGKDVMDQLMLKSHFYMGISGSMRDNAAAILQADIDLFSGVHLQTLITKLSERNFIAFPTIYHQALRDIEQTVSSFNISADVTDGFYPVDTNGVYVVWGRSGTFTDTSALHQVDFSSLYSGTIPTDGNEAQYQYYLLVEDTAGRFTTSPKTAPSSFYSFYAGQDTVKPSVHFRPFYDQDLFHFPLTIQLTTTDNIGIDTVFVEYTNQRSSSSGVFPMHFYEDSTYEATFPFDTLNTQIGDSIFYRITVKDAAISSNATHLPSEGWYSFRVSSGNILLVIDDSVTTHLAPVSSFSLFYSTLLSTTFSVDTVLWKRLSNRNLSNYNMIILSSGLNVLPLALTSYRQAIVDYVTQGGRVLTEGGETGHWHREKGPFDADPYFRRIVLHDSLWLGNVPGTNLSPVTPVNRIFTTPNTLAQPISFTDRTTGAYLADRDAVTLMPGDSHARIIGTWGSSSDSGAIVEYQPATWSGPQTIFFAFALSSITDTMEAKHLVINALASLFPRSGLTAVDEPNVFIPRQFTLEQNYPNPFNPSTVIRYSLTTSSYVNLKVYDILGREIAVLFEGVQEAGEKTQLWDATGVSGGVYFYRLSVTDEQSNETKFLDVRKAVLIK